jgi:hypothetical protein
MMNSLTRERPLWSKFSTFRAQFQTVSSPCTYRTATRLGKIAQVVKYRDCTQNTHFRRRESAQLCKPECVN